MEWSLFDEELQLAGTVDALFRDKRADEYAHDDLNEPEDGKSEDTSDGECITLVLGDWKRSKSIVFQNQWQRGLPGTPVEHMDDCNYNHYTLQLNVYKRMLKKYNVRITRMFLVVFHPGQPSYIKVPINPEPDVIEEMFNHRRAQLRQVKHRGTKRAHA
jgi:hypothetical protein